MCFSGGFTVFSNTRGTMRNPVSEREYDPVGTSSSVHSRICFVLPCQTHFHPRSLPALASCASLLLTYSSVGSFICAASLLRGLPAVPGSSSWPSLGCVPTLISSPVSSCSLRLQPLSVVFGFLFSQTQLFCPGIFSSSASPPQPLLVLLQV